MLCSKRMMICEKDCNDVHGRILETKIVAIISFLCIIMY